MQRVVAHLSEDYLPFTFPRPVGDPPAPDPAVTARRSGMPGPRATRQPGTDPSAVAESGVVPVGPSAGGPTDRADGRLPHRDVRKPERVRPSAARPPAPLRSADGPFGASTVEEDLTAAVTMTPAAPSPQGWEVTAAPDHPDRGADRRPAGCTERSDERAGRSLPVNGSVARPDARPVVRPGQPAAHDAVLRDAAVADVERRDARGCRHGPGRREDGRASRPGRSRRPSPARRRPRRHRRATPAGASRPGRGAGPRTPRPAVPRSAREAARPPTS